MKNRPICRRRFFVLVSALSALFAGASGSSRAEEPNARANSEYVLPRVPPLSPQEQRLLPLVAQGKTNKEIAAELGLSDKTVKNYLANVYNKLHITRRSQAAAFYSKHFS